jgi:DMSO/TMAO reductase YedYZ molybdopterin-dependent catalytic subunit
MDHSLTRRQALQAGVIGMLAPDVSAQGVPKLALPSRDFLTPAEQFRDVSRGEPVPHSLQGEDRVKARLTPETWRLEIGAEDKAELTKPLRIVDGSALDYAGLLRLGEKHAIRFLKAMQCNNIALPLGQGLWEGVPLREVLKACGRITNARRLYYWGFHNNDPKQIFRSSLSMNQILDTPPGEMPPFLAYRLNGEPLSLERGGPVRMVVPWAHGFKSVKWLQHIMLTNSYAANDTYALQNNDPESYLKTAAYLDTNKSEKFVAGKPVTVRGTAMVGWPGLERIEWWLRADAGTNGKIDDNDPAWQKADWKPIPIDAPPADWKAVSAKDIWGFSAAGMPKEWPLRYSVAHWTVVISDLAVGKYELRIRTVDKNGYAQPEPRPDQRSGMNLIPCKLFEVTG